MPLSSDAVSTVSRLSREFCVRDMMVAGPRLVCAAALDEARSLLERNPDFDMIPIRRGGVLTSFLERGSNRIQDIGIHDLITESTGLLDAVEVLATRPRAFVLVRDRVAGFVHFSDFNHPIVKVPFFILLEAVERRCFQSLAGKLKPETLAKALGSERFEAVDKKMRYLQERRANPNWAAVLSFADTLVCAQHVRSVVASTSDIHSLSRVRNLVCHAGTDLLVEEHSHIGRLVRARNTCYRLLEVVAA